MKVSKELFEAVMNVKINKLEIDNFDYIWINIDRTDLSRVDSINNFFFKCMNWSWSRECLLIISPQGNNFKDKPFYKVKIMNNAEYIKTFTDMKLSQQQAVFDACQWILDNKGN